MASQFIAARSMAAATILMAISISSVQACCANYAEFAAQCRAQGGIPSTGAVCSPGAVGSVGGGMNSNQQLMGLAGALGSAFGEMLRQHAANEALARQQEAARAVAEMVRFQAEERERARRMEERHRLLLAGLKGTVGTAPLEMKRGSVSETLNLKVGDDYLGSTQQSVTLNRSDAATEGPIQTPDEPSVPVGTLVSLEDMSKLKTVYERAADEFAKADLHRRQLQDEKALAEKIRSEAEKMLADQRARAGTTPVESPAVKPEEDNRLAEAERLLRQAIELDEKATRDLDQAKRDVEQATRGLERADREREKAEQSLAQAVPESP